MESRRVTIVQYDLTSSEDEKDADQTYVYSSSKLSPLSASEFLFEPPAEEDQSDHSEQNSVLVLESDSASDDAGPCSSAKNKRPRLSGSASSDLEIIANTTATGPIYVSSSSGSEDQDSGALVPGRKPYSIGLQELPASLREFLAEAYAFFTSSHRLERAAQRVSLTTYGKAQERVLCEYCLFISLKYVMFGLFRISDAVCSIPRET